MLSTTLVEYFQIECITPYEVNQYIQKLNPNKSGIDGIGSIILKQVEMQFLQPSLKKYQLFTRRVLYRIIIGTLLNILVYSICVFKRMWS